MIIGAAMPNLCVTSPARKGKARRLTPYVRVLVFDVFFAPPARGATRRGRNGRPQDLQVHQAGSGSWTPSATAGAWTWGLGKAFPMGGRGRVPGPLVADGPAVGRAF